MSTLSVPLTPNLEKAVEELVKEGYGPNKASVVRMAIKKLSEEAAVEAVLRAQREVTSGKVLRGDLRKILKQLK